MSQKTVVELIDDTDGTIATGTVRFGLDRTNYEIDLNDANATALRETLARYIAHGRRIAGLPAKRIRAGKDQEFRTGLRAWAAENGFVVNPRGRIPADITAKYDLARQAAPPTGNGAAPQSPAQSDGAAPAPSSATVPEGAAETGSGPRRGKRATTDRADRPTGNGAAPQSPGAAPAEPPAAVPATEPARPAETSSGPGNGGLTATERTVIRAWARLQGIKLGDRGRIPAEIIDKYRRAHPSGGPE